MKKNEIAKESLSDLLSKAQGIQSRGPFSEPDIQQRERGDDVAGSDEAISTVDCSALVTAASVCQSHCSWLELGSERKAGDTTSPS